jgi:hypothetical protein
MQFFDYDADLSLFNSLMEETEAPANTEAGEPAQGNDTAKTPKQRGSKKSTGKSKFTGSTIVKAISDALTNKDLNYKLFYETYYPKEPESKPFVLCKAGGFTIKNDPHLGDYVQKTDDTHITVNLSAAINAKSRSKVAKDLEHMQDKRAYADREDSLYQLAKIQVLDSFATLINHVLKDPEYEKNKILDPEEKKELQKKAREEKNAQKAQAEQNPQEEQQPQEQQKSPEEQQPQEEQKPQEQQPQNDPNTPSDDDPKEQFKKIRANYNENYKNDLKYYCEKNADDLDDEGKSALADQYYDKAMEDFQEVQDPEVQQKVQDMIQSDIELYSQPNKKNDSDSDNDKDNPNDFNWGQDDKDKKDGESEDDGDSDDTDNSGTSPANNNKGFFNWINNTMNNWEQNGVTNKAANPRPQGGVQRMDYTWKQSQRDRNGVKAKPKKKKTVDQQLDED